MTATVHLNSLHPDAVAEWNAAGTEERTIDAAWLCLPGRAPLSGVRLRIVGGVLMETSPVPPADLAQVPPLAVIPPLVNAHTHLEFSTLAEPISPPFPFPDWIRSVIRWRIDHPQTPQEGVRAGLQECRQNAVVGIGEITTSDDGGEALQGSDTAVVSFRELIGLLPETVPDQLEIMRQHLHRRQDDSAQSQSDAINVRAGISPHAPYSVHPDLLAAVVDACQQDAVPVAMHLGETTDELELLDRATGRFADFLRELNLWRDDVLPPGRRILTYLQQLARLPRSLAIHCNYLTPEEIRFLGDHPQVCVVYCPRTHAYFGHADHPWTAIRQAGGSVVLGTDGRSSNPDLSIWKELQFLASRDQTLTLSDLLPMVTTDAARALGLDRRLNSVERFQASLIQLTNDQPAERALLNPKSRPAGRLLSRNGTVVLQSAAD